MPRLDQLVGFWDDFHNFPREIKERLNGSNIDRAYFLHQHALGINLSFTCRLQDLFNLTDFKLKCKLKDNLGRIG